MVILVWGISFKRDQQSNNRDMMKKITNMLRQYPIVRCSVHVLSFLLLINIVGGLQLSALAQDRPTFLRYQGIIDQVSGELPDAIDCSFYLKNSNDDQLWSERHDTVYVIERHFTVALGRETPLTQDLFFTPVSLHVECDVDADGDYDIRVTELIGETPRAALALSAQGPIKADYLEVNGNPVINELGQWVGPPLANLPNPEEADQVANKAYVDSRITSTSLQITTLQESLTAQITEAQDAQEIQLTGLQGQITTETDRVRADTSEEITDVQTQLSTQITQQITESEARDLSARQDIDPTYPKTFTYRSRLFETFDVNSETYLFGDQASLFGGVAPSAWSSGATADQVDLDQVGAFLIDEGQAGANALLSMSKFEQISDQQGIFFIAHFQVENTAEVVKSWTLDFEYSCYESRVNGPQSSSLALNGESAWSSLNLTCSSLSQSTQVTLDLPPQEISDVVMVIAGSTPSSGATNPGVPYRRVMFAFTSECLSLPEGLRYRKVWY
jgi:hypothetical protein